MANGDPPIFSTPIVPQEQIDEWSKAQARRTDKLKNNNMQENEQLPQLSESPKNKHWRENYPVIRDKFGAIDWAKMIPEEFLYVAEDAAKRDGIDLNDTKTKLDPKYVRVKLGGFRFLARYIGYSSVEYKTIVSEYERSVISCAIEFNPTEDFPNGCLVTATAGANPQNTTKAFLPHLDVIASNRAFSKCVRSHLGIEIISDAEEGKVKETSEPAVPKEVNNEQLSSNAALNKALNAAKVHNLAEAVAKVSNWNKDYFSHEGFKDFDFATKEIKDLNAEQARLMLAGLKKCSKV